MNNNNSNQSLAWVKVDGKLTVVLPSGETASISSDHKNFEPVLEAIRNGNWDLVPDLMSSKNLIHSFSDGNFEVVDDHVVYNGEHLPSALSDKIIEFAEEKLPYEPLIKFWTRLKENPSYRAVQQLYGFLLKNNHAITNDGNFIAYKAVRSDFMDKYTGKISNKPGETVKIPRNQVDEDPERTCSRGLHAANYDYAKNQYGTSGDVMLMLEINPKDVVAIPVDYNQAKMRVCEYKVLSVVNYEYKKPLYNPEHYDDLDENDDDCENDCYCYDEEDEDDNC